MSEELIMCYSNESFKYFKNKKYLSVDDVLPLGHLQNGTTVWPHIIVQYWSFCLIESCYF